MTKYYAHTNGPDPEKWQLLEDHLKNVSHLAAQFAAEFGAEDWGKLAGLWHDLGKYSEALQSYLREQNGLEAHLEGQPGKVNHSSAGALWAREKLGEARGRLLAYCILGHHAGLPDYSLEHGGGSSVKERLTKEPPPFRDNVPRSLGEQQTPSSQVSAANPSLWIRMLFSSLVDADFLDTERFMDPARFKARQSEPAEMKALDEALTHYLDDLVRSAPSGNVNEVRKAVLEQCREAAKQPPGIRTLTVPTGGGKTLSSLAFALRHAHLHGKRRVIYVIPFTSIIEQTADVFRSIPGLSEYVLEHHSNLDPDDPKRVTPKSRLAAENWDAPIVITTSVQFFESLHANRTSACRKLHNIAQSVVIFDEAQALPLPVLQPVVSMIHALSTAYGVTPVLCTATQPALETREDGLRHGISGMEIIDQPDTLHLALKRVQARKHPAWPNPVAWDALAEELEQQERVLCIVHRKDDALRLHSLMPQGTWHLSTRMCGAHRSAHIAQIKEALMRKDGASVRVVSTQLIEAGVDVDFPVVYRALGGLDSLAQAAGRCNREGRAKAGDFVIFAPDSAAPPSLQTAQDIGRILLDEDVEDLLAPERFRLFFEKYFAARGADYFDKYGVEALLNSKVFEFQYATAAERFRMIEDGWQRPVIVHYGESCALVDALIRGAGSPRDLMRKLQRYTVQIPIQAHNALVEQEHIKSVHEDYPHLYQQSASNLYRADVGLVLPSEQGDVVSMEPQII